MEIKKLYKAPQTNVFVRLDTYRVMCVSANGNEDYQFNEGSEWDE